MESLLAIIGEIKKLNSIDFTKKVRFNIVEYLYLQLYELHHNTFMNNIEYSDQLRDAVFTLCAEMSYIRDLIDLHRSVDERQRDILNKSIKDVLECVNEKKCNVCTYKNPSNLLNCEICNNVI